LEEIRLNWSAVKDGHFDYAGAAQGFAKAFRDYGFDVEVLPVEAAAARIRESHIGAELAVALDSWAWARAASRKGGGRALLAVARAADPDEWRGRLRDVLEGRDEGALAELARLERADALPALTLALVVWDV